MQVNDESFWSAPFWSALRRSIAEAEAAVAEEHACAAQLLAEVDAERGGRPAEQLGDAQIDAMVARALAPEPPVAVQPGAALPAARRPLLGRVLVAAVAMLLTPQFLAAATVATVAVVASAFLLQHTTQALTFQRAVEILMDEGESAANRDLAQGTVYGDLLDGIDALRVAAGDPGELGAQASGVLGRLRTKLHTPDPFVPRPLTGVPLLLGDQVMDAGLDQEVRAGALSLLAELMVYGVSALKATELAALPPRVQQNNRVLLERLAEQLR